ncbi:hypothetical protein CERSUDRAFT_95717 [Gelatoporia subvermispora B]|uniref:Carboxylesterase type B domain-containing protein n=1 Tax=Ceriporiopsis subvermispora (strain B) TaxID=914234 RepID=M2QWB7_CERS8|nr:hypothetical protein CERSUDRAFT_95717 [Gelatoporia subvermispora B]
MSNIFAMLITGLSLISLSTALTVPSTGSPSILLDEGVFIGKRIHNTDAFLGISYAEPPVGNLRFRQPEEIAPYSGTYNASQFGNICPQEGAGLVVATNISYMIPFEETYNAVFPSLQVAQSEDCECLNLDVYIPAGTKPGKNLPVLMWMPFGGFLDGGSSTVNGAVIVERSLQNREPVIIPSTSIHNSNARAVFGFLPGQEAKDAGITNLGLRDQRQALRWIQRYIHQFGGNPAKVILWGANAGGISAGLQMLNNGGDTEGLFSAAWMQSGIPIPLNTYSQLQGTYDIFVNKTSCKGSSESLECLRQLPLEELLEAMAALPDEQRFLRWQVLLDYDFIAEQPETLLRQGKVARIPFVIGCTEDEGTLGAQNLTDIETDEEVATWLMQEGLPGIPMDAVEEIFTLYPSDPAAGSPFGTGDLYAITPQYKRISALIGDIEYHSQRRFFLNHTAGYQDTWSYLSKEFKYPFIGALDLTDLFNIWGPGDLTDRLISFANTQNPNNGTGIDWPQWSISAPHQLNIHNDSSFTVEDDTFRAEGIDLLMTLNIQYPE